MEPPPAQGTLKQGPACRLPPLEGVAELSAAELVRCWHSYWEDSQLAFCREFGLERIPFNFWLKQRPQWTDYGNEAVRKLLIGLLSGERQGRRLSLQNSGTQEDTSVRFSTELGGDAKRLVKDAVGAAPAETYEDITFFLIDGDTCAREVLNLAWLLPTHGRPPFVAVVVAGATMVVPQWWRPQHTWSFWYRVGSALPNAADVGITLVASGIAMWWEVAHPSAAAPRIAIVTRDTFVTVVATLLQEEWGLSCAGVDPSSVSIILWYLFHLSIPGPTEPAQRMKQALDAHYSLHWKAGDSNEPLAKRLKIAFENPDFADMHVTASGLHILDELAVRARQAPASPSILASFARLSIAPQPSTEPHAAGMKAPPRALEPPPASAPEPTSPPSPAPFAGATLSPPALSAAHSPSAPASRVLGGMHVVGDFRAHPHVLALKQELAHRDAVPLTEVGNRWPAKDLAPLGYTKWTALLAVPLVLEFLDAEIGVAKNNKQCLYPRRAHAGALAAPNLQTATDEDLRTLWHTLWGAERTQAEFCRAFECNPSHFSAWLNRKRAIDLASSGAVRRWLKSIGFVGN